MKRALVAGAGGFIGGHLVEYLKTKDYYVVGIDIKSPEFRASAADNWYHGDLRYDDDVSSPFSGATFDFDECYQLAASMGGMGFISRAHTEILHDNALINIHMIDTARRWYVKRYFFSSSACAYPESKQEEYNAYPLTENDAYPAAPQDAYGWEKVYGEQLIKYYRTPEFQTKVARFHNTYGPYGAWTGGREKAPAALCRKVAEAKLSDSHEIEVWGDGQAQRTFLYVSDLVEGIYRLTKSDHPGPMNLGSTEQVTIDELAYLIADIAQWEIEIVHVPGPQGVRSRNSDNSLAEKVLGWTPKVSLRQGLEMTYPWIEEQVRKTKR